MKTKKELLTSYTETRNDNVCAERGMSTNDVETEKMENEREHMKTKLELLKSDIERPGPITMRAKEEVLRITRKHRE